MDSYENILDRMIQRYVELSDITPSEQSDTMIRHKVLAGEVYNNLVATEFVKRQMFVISADGEYLDKHAQQRGLNRKQAIKAVGEVTFSIPAVSENDVVIEQGTVVSTADTDVRQFVTTQSAVISAGKLSTKVSVQAVEGGAKYNVLKNTVSVLVTPPMYVTSVTNEKDFKGGVDKESDEELRERILYSYKDISNGTNAVYYKRLSESIEGVYSASVISGVRGAGTIDVRICGKGSAKVNKDHIEAVQKLLDENRELCVDIMVLYAAPVDVYFRIGLKVKEGYSFDTVSAQLKEKITEHIDSLGVGKPVLLCDLGEIIYHTDGVKNYEFFDAVCGDVYPTQSQYCAVEEIDIRAVS